MTSQRQTTLFEDVLLDADKLANEYDDNCQRLVALSDWQTTVILSLIRYAEWPSRWALGSHTWDEIEAKISELEYCLMAGCNVEELLDRFDTLNGYMSTLVGRLITPGGDNIAEAIAGQELTCGDTTVNFDTEAITDAIIAQTTMQEERSIAEVTGQNTNFSDLVTAVNGLELSAICSPDVNITVQGGSGGCCGGGEGKIVDPPLESITETTPPPGMQPIVDQTNTQRCRNINCLIDWIGGAIHDLNIMGIGGTVNTGVDIIITGLAFAASKNPLIAYQTYKILGYIEGIVTLINAQINLSTMDTIFNDPDTKKALVCAWYNCSEYDAACAYSGMGEVLLDAGMNSSEIALVAAIAGHVGVSGIWFEETGSYPIYEEMNNYTGGIDCGECATPGVFDFTVDEQGWLIDEAGSTNGQYITDTTFRGITTGSTDGKLSIYYPELATITDLKAWIYGTLGQVTYIDVQTADSLEGPWTVEAYHEFVSTAGDFTMNEFTGLSITNKYIKVYLKRFWSDPEVDIQRVEWE